MLVSSLQAPRELEGEGCNFDAHVLQAPFTPTSLSHEEHVSPLNTFMIGDWWTRLTLIQEDMRGQFIWSVRFLTRMKTQRSVVGLRRIPSPPCPSHPIGCLPRTISVLQQSISWWIQTEVYSWNSIEVVLRSLHCHTFMPTLEDIPRSTVTFSFPLPCLAISRIYVEHPSANISCAFETFYVIDHSNKIMPNNGNTKTFNLNL